MRKSHFEEQALQAQMWRWTLLEQCWLSCHNWHCFHDRELRSSSRFTSCMKKGGGSFNINIPYFFWVGIIFWDWSCWCAKAWVRSSKLWPNTSSLSEINNQNITIFLWNQSMHASSPLNLPLISICHLVDEVSSNQLNWTVWHCSLQHE